MAMLHVQLLSTSGVCGAVAVQKAMPWGRLPLTLCCIGQTEC